MMLGVSQGNPGSGRLQEALLVICSVVAAEWAWSVGAEGQRKLPRLVAAEFSGNQGQRCGPLQSP